MHTNFSGSNFRWRRISYAEKKRQHNIQVFIYMICGLLFISMASPLAAQLPAVPHLSTIQTAEPVGKGGSSTSFGLLQYAEDTVGSEHRQNVNIGGFDELHRVSLQVETFLVPVRFNYGLTDELDLVLGGTFSTGGAQKIVYDFYSVAEETDIDPTADRRVYDQSLFEGVIGLKYNIKPDRNDNLPSISMGGDVQVGFTADDQLNSDNEFLDYSPADGFPFFGINTYMVGTQRLGSLFKVHAGVGVFLTSKSLKTTDFFRFNWQLGGEVAIADNMRLTGDFSRELAYAGMHLKNLFGLAFRYEVSDTLAFQLGFNSRPGFQFNLTFGGEKAQTLGGENLLF